MSSHLVDIVVYARSTTTATALLLVLGLLLHYTQAQCYLSSVRPSVSLSVSLMIRAKAAN